MFEFSAEVFGRDFSPLPLAVALVALALLPRY